MPSVLSSKFKTMVNIFITIVGSGVLGLPYTSIKLGWLYGVLTLFCIAFLTCYCMLLLVSTRQKIESPNGYSKINSFGDLDFFICCLFEHFAIDLMIILSHAGFCSSYLIFITNTLVHLLNNNSSESSFFGMSPKKWYLWGSFAFQLGLNSVPTFTYLGSLSIFADVVQIGAMAVVMGKDAVVYAQNRLEIQAFGNWGVFFNLVGVCTYAFEGIGMVLPLEFEARDKQSFGKFLGLSIGMIPLLYGVVGVRVTLPLGMKLGI